METQSILCPVDFSSSSRAALGYASRLAQEFGATLHIAFVEESTTPLGIGVYGQLPTSLTADSRALMKIEPTTAGLPFERHLLLGIPHEEILRLANEQKIDLIVMGSHGRKGLSRLLLGSVAENVLRKACCPVLIVRELRKEDSGDDHTSHHSIAPTSDTSVA